MKIVHICLTGAVTDGFSYQDNLLPKYHARLGYKVVCVTSRFVFDTSGEITRTENIDYVTKDGVHIIRLKCSEKTKYQQKFKRFKGLKQTLEHEKPDIVFIHGVQFLEMPQVVRYVKRHENVRVFVDNHADQSNSGQNFLSLNILHKIIWKHMAKIISPYTEKFYGVLPARVDWLHDVYGISREKCDLLVMGADDDQVERVSKRGFREKIRERLGVSSTDELIVSGGKFDRTKWQILILAAAVQHSANQKLKLRIFGSIDDELRDQLMDLCDGERVSYVGWANAAESYDYFEAADLAVFPGRHSVFWEQVVALGVPLICKYWEGTTHVDIGGNVVFIETDSETEYSKTIESLNISGIKYRNMRIKAQSSKRLEFLYSHIAQKSIQ